MVYFYTPGSSETTSGNVLFLKNNEQHLICIVFSKEELPKAMFPPVLHWTQSVEADNLSWKGSFKLCIITWVTAVEMYRMTNGPGLLRIEGQV